MPDILSKHEVISDECRANHGDVGAIDVALHHIKTNYLGLLKAWPQGKGAKFHVKLSVEYEKEV